MLVIVVVGKGGDVHGAKKRHTCLSDSAAEALELRPCDLFRISPRFSNHRVERVPSVRRQRQITDSRPPLLLCTPHGPRCSGYAKHLGLELARGPVERQT